MTIHDYAISHNTFVGQLNDWDISLLFLIFALIAALCVVIGNSEDSCGWD